jgi:hypothetical protein
MRLVVIRNPSGKPGGVYSIHEKEAFVGRGRKRSGNGNFLLVSKDTSISRRHARVFEDRGSLWIEDLGSTNGTFLESERIAVKKPVRLRPGARVQTGNTIWTAFPDDWMLIRHGDVITAGDFIPEISYSLVNCGVLPLGELYVINIGTVRSSSFGIRIEVERYSDQASVTIGALLPNESKVVDPPEIKLYVGELMGCYELVWSRFRVWINSDSDSVFEERLAVLGFWDWSHRREARKTLVSFISPSHRIVERIVSESQNRLGEKFGYDTYHEILRSGDDRTEKMITQAVYESLSENTSIHYISPNLKSAEGGRVLYQTIMSPDRLFTEDDPKLSGRGTCLDLSLLFDACLEAVGLYPLLVLICDVHGVPRHSLSGCWVGAAPGSRPVIDDKDLVIHEMETGSMIFLESTGFARGIAGAGKRIPVDEAIKSASEQIRKAPRICLIDVSALRPPIGHVMPIDSPMEPEVLKAYDLARRVALSKNAVTLETTHLFYGLVASGGSIMSWLLEELHMTPEGVGAEVERLIPNGEADGTLMTTANYFACTKLAEHYAWKTGSYSVRELDLIWAFLDRGKESRGLMAVLKKIGITYEKIRQLMESRYSRPQPPYGSYPSMTPGEF